MFLPTLSNAIASFLVFEYLRNVLQLLNREERGGKGERKEP